MEERVVVAKVGKPADPCTNDYKAFARLIICGRRVLYVELQEIGQLFKVTNEC